MEQQIWNSGIRSLSGVGEKRAQCYHRLGVDTVGDLLRFYPRTYLDFTNPLPIMELPLNETGVVRARVFKKGREQRIRKGLTLYKVFVTDDVSDMTVTIFNSKFAFEALKEGEAYYFYGKALGNLVRREMNAPLIYPEWQVTGMSPIYPLTEGLTNKMVQTNVRQALTMVRDEIPEALPEEIIQKYQLYREKFALEQIHFPKDEEHRKMAWERLAFEELLTLQLGLQMLKHRNRKEAGVSVPPADLRAFFRSLPFKPTNAQHRAIAEAQEDMMGTVPMSRLLQGDVGSGKTLVAAALCYCCAKAGIQAAMMAPTEILAQQHANTLAGLLEPLGVSVGLLTGSVPAKGKKLLKERLECGDIDVVVGTHALVQDSTAFARLGLVITDEQHRFGVAQRSKLLAKGENPHMLVMSATPIPRTLALIIYGDLDISVLDELPKGRQKVETYRIHSSKRARAVGFIRKHIDEGRQAYIVCPLVEQDDESDLLSVEEYVAALRNGPLQHYRVGLLHGKMKPADKHTEMEAFVSGQTQVLVATTVIEVGVDVPNAVVMMVENAERFGLSQLHQLRGRVGRGQYQSYCILVSDLDTLENNRRLEAMCQTSDGFVIAEQDLKLRGPGDFFGERQHGLPQLRIAHLLEDAQILRETQQLATELLREDPALSQPGHRGLLAMTQELFEPEGERKFH